MLNFFGYRPFILKTQSMEPMCSQERLCCVYTRASLKALSQDVELSRINYVGGEVLSIPGLGSAVDKLISHHIIWISIIVFILLARAYVHAMAELSRPGETDKSLIALGSTLR